MSPPTERVPELSSSLSPSPVTKTVIPPLPAEKMGLGTGAPDGCEADCKLYPGAQTGKAAVRFL